MNRISKRQKRKVTNDKLNDNNGAGGGGNKPTSDYADIVKSIEALGGKYKAAQKSQSDHNQKTLFWNRLTGWGVIVYTGLTFFIMLASMFGAIYSRQQASSAEKSVVAVQRAFIVVSGLKEEAVHTNDKVTGFKFTPIIRNSGNTPAKQVRWATLDPFNVGFSPQFRQFAGEDNPVDPDQFFNQPEKISLIQIGRGILGPQDTLLLAPEFPIDDRAFQSIISGRLDRFYFGAIRYFDQFSEKERVTKYCYTINNFSSGDGFEASGPGVKAPAVHPFPVLCQHWNCADEDCAADKKRYEEEKRQTPQPAKVVK
jgi:hypothetical protein